MKVDRTIRAIPRRLSMVSSRPRVRALPIGRVSRDIVAFLTLFAVLAARAEYELQRAAVRQGMTPSSSTARRFRRRRFAKGPFGRPHVRTATAAQEQAFAQLMVGRAHLSVRRHASGIAEAPYLPMWSCLKGQGRWSSPPAPGQRGSAVACRRHAETEVKSYHGSYCKLRARAAMAIAPLPRRPRPATAALKMLLAREADRTQRLSISLAG